MSKKKKKINRVPVLAILGCTIIAVVGLFVWANVKFFERLHTAGESGMVGVLSDIRTREVKEASAKIREGANADANLRGSASGTLKHTRHRPRAGPDKWSILAHATELTEETSASAASGASASAPLLSSPSSSSSSSSSSAVAVPHQRLPDPVHRSVAALGDDTLLLIIASNRPDYLKRCLTHVVEHHPLSSVPIVVSQDLLKHKPHFEEQQKQVEEAVKEAQDALIKRGGTVPFHHVTRDALDPAENGYFALSDHFNATLHDAFSPRPFDKDDLSGRIQRVIILEEDLEIAADFFSFFAAVRPMVDTDDSVLAASAFNDNGFQGMVRDAKKVYRSDFFPGLGWMLPRRVWDELATKWPRAYWDDWLREPPQRKGRHTLRPEVCRSLHYGFKGVSVGQFQDHLRKIKLNGESTNVDFAAEDMGYLAQDQWRHDYLAEVVSAPVVDVSKVEGGMVDSYSAVRVLYDNNPPRHRAEHAMRTRDEHGQGGSKEKVYDDYARTANRLGVMDNIKAGVPRTAYMGIVSFWKGETKVHLVPQDGPSTDRVK